MVLKGIKMKRSDTGIPHYVRISFPDLMENDFDAYHRLVSKYRSRAKARGYNPSNLKQEEWNVIFNDNLPKLEKGEKVHTSWIETVGKGLIEEALEYLNSKPSNDKLDEDSNPWEWLIVPGSVKMAAKGLKWGDDFLLQASYLPSCVIDKVKEKLEFQNKSAADLF